MIKVDKISSLKEVTKKRQEVSKDMKMIDEYSARKIMTKVIDLNSVLKPLTSSLSPSAKSKGDRFVSARTEMRNIKHTKSKKEKTGICLDWVGS